MCFVVASVLLLFVDAFICVYSSCMCVVFLRLYIQLYLLALHVFCVCCCFVFSCMRLVVSVSPACVFCLFFCFARL